MCSIPNGLKASVICAAAMLLMCGGCQMADYSPEPYQLNQNPLIVDAAMQKRDWDPSPVYYQNDLLIAGPTEVLLKHNPRNPKYANAVVETPLFMVNSLACPFMVFISPKWAAVGYKSMTMPPSSTAQPAFAKY